MKNILFSLKEAAEQTGIDVGKIFNWIISGEIDGEKNLEGAWCVSESGMVALKRKLSRPVPQVTEAEMKVKKIIKKEKPVKPVEPRKTKPVPQTQSTKKIICEARCNIRTADDEKIYGRVKEAAVLFNMPVGDLLMIITRNFVTHNLDPVIHKLETLEEQKTKLITGLIKFE